MYIRYTVFSICVTLLMSILKYQVYNSVSDFYYFEFVLKFWRQKVQLCASVHIIRLVNGYPACNTIQYEMYGIICGIYTNQEPVRSRSEWASNTKKIPWVQLSHCQTVKYITNQSQSIYVLCLLAHCVIGPFRSRPIE